MRARAKRDMHRKVTVLNNTYEVLSFITWQQAITKIVSGTAEILEKDSEVPIRTAGGIVFPYPVSIIMKNYISVDWAGARPMSDELAAKSAILSRDGFMCMYCGEMGTTVDHVLPKSRGGANTWLNLVCACQSCNSYKADRTPEEAGMSLIREPFRPEIRSRREKAQDDIYSRLESGEINIEGDDD